MFSSLFRTVNRWNPTLRGRHRVMSLAERFGAVPREGVYDIGNRMTMHLRPDQFVDRLIYFLAMEPIVAQTLLGQLNPGNVFLDLGANIGYYTLSGAQKVGPAGRVISFEPQPQICARLRENVTRNNLQHVTVHELALGEQDGSFTLYIPPAEIGFGHASLSPQEFQNATAVEVQVRRLDDLLLPTLDRLDVIKLDAEGAELSILRGARQLIEKFQPSIVVELNPETAAYFDYQPLDLAAFLAECCPHYRFVHLDGHHAVERTLQGHRDAGVTVGDLFAWNPHRQVQPSSVRSAA